MYVGKRAFPQTNLREKLCVWFPDRCNHVSLGMACILVSILFFEAGTENHADIAIRYPTIVTPGSKSCIHYVL